jgi:hypothetical protein
LIEIQYENCASVSDSGTITLTIVCDASNSPITLSTATPVSVNFFNQPPGSTTTVYSHYNCGPPTFTIVDAGAINLESWITADLVMDTFTLIVDPT